MATGDKKFSSQGEEVQGKTAFPLPEPGDYEYKVIASSTTVKAGKDSGVPYVGGTRLLLLGSASEKTGNKDISVFLELFLSLTPGKDGVKNTHRKNGIVAFARSLGEELTDMDVMEVENQKKNTTEDILSPQEVKKWVQDHDGRTGKAHIKIRRDAEYGDKAEVAYFIPAEEPE